MKMIKVIGKNISSRRSKCKYLTEYIDLRTNNNIGEVVYNFLVIERMCTYTYYMAFRSGLNEVSEGIQ